MALTPIDNPFAPTTGGKLTRISKPGGFWSIPPKPSLGEAMATGTTAEAFGTPSTSAAVAQGALLNSPEAVMQMAGVPIPKPLQRFREIAKQDPAGKITHGVLGGEAVGSAIGPMNWFAPEMRFISPLARIASAATRGAVSSVLTPVEDEASFWTKKGKQALWGAIFGAPFGAVGAPAARDAQTVMEHGIRVTPPSAVAGGQQVERFLGAFPGARDLIEHGKNITIEDFNRALFRDALADLGVAAPNQVGSEGLNAVQTAISAALNHANSRMSLQGNQAFQNDIQRTVTDAWGRMSPESFRQFQQALLNHLYMPLSRGSGGLNGMALAKSVSDLLDLARGRMRGNASPDDFALASAYRDVANDLLNNSQGPADMRRLRDVARRAYAKYITLSRAAASGGASSEGVITPHAFLTSLSRQFGAERFQRDALPDAAAQEMKDLAEATRRVLGVGGTTYRPYLGGGSAGLAGLIYALQGAPGWEKVLAGAVPMAAGYTGPGMSLFRVLASSPTRQQLVPRLATPAGAVAGEQEGESP